MTALNVVQKIAHNAQETGTKIAELIAEHGIDTDEIKETKIIEFGANMFVCLIVYGMMREVRTLSTKTGMKIATGIMVLLDPLSAWKRTLTTSIGLTATLVLNRLRFYRIFSTNFGLISSMFYGVGTKLNTKFGLITTTPLFGLSTTSAATIGTLATMDYLWHDINQSAELNSTFGLKLAWAVLYNGVPVDL